MSSPLERYRQVYEEGSADALLPIECVVNVMLLYAEVRLVVQLDVTFYTDARTIDAIHSFVRRCPDVCTRYDAMGNVVLYLEAQRVRVERRLKRIGRGDPDAAFRTTKFGAMLDSVFYACETAFPAVLLRPRVVQVSVSVVQSECKAGPLLVKLCSRRSASRDAQALHRHFLRISRAVEALDASLQTVLSFHTKPGYWKATPEYVPASYRTLSPLLPATSEATA
jgi:hypothetical protein